MIRGAVDVPADVPHIGYTGVGTQGDGFTYGSGIHDLRRRTPRGG